MNFQGANGPVPILFMMTVTDDVEQSVMARLSP